MKRGVRPDGPASEPVYLTPAGFEHLKGRLQKLKDSLPRLIEETARTAAYGDRSENAEYQDAKSALRRTHRQIWSIEDRLKRVAIIKPGGSGSGAVELGTTVVLETEKGEEKTYEIVGPQETNPERGRISYLSPLGKALAGRKKGETVSFATPRGMQIYRIVSVR